MMAPAHQQRSEWAAGLVVSTTCLDQDEKAKVQHDVVAAGGRYSPNLSKRTTHLVAPAHVSNVSQKLLAAAEQNRYRGLHIVSSDWLQASISSLKKVKEADYQLNIPQVSSANGPLVTPAPNSASSRQPGSVSASPAAAAPQTPWVVHFSQMGDSIYGVPELGSPNSHEQFVQQLQPIAEMPSPPTGTAGTISPEIAAVLAASNKRPSGQCVAAAHPQASIKQQSVQSNGLTEVAAAPASPCNAQRSAPLQLASDRPSPRAEPAAAHTAGVTAGAQLPDTLRELLAAPNTSGTKVRWEQQTSPRCHNRPPPLRLDSNSSSRQQAAQPTSIRSGGNASIASGSTSGKVDSNSRQQQDIELQHSSAVKEVAGSLNASGSVEQLLQAIRPSGNRFRTQSTHIAQDSLLPAAAAAVRSFNTVDELMGAVQVAGASGDRWRTAADAPLRSTVAEPGPRQTSHLSLSAQLQRQRQQSEHNSPMAPSSRETSSVNDLIDALRRVTSDVAGTAAAGTISNPGTAAAGTAASTADNGPLHGVARRASLDDSSSKIASLMGAWQQVKEQAQQIAQVPNAAVPAGGSGAGSLGELDVDNQPMHAKGDLPESAALASFSSVPELVAALRGATGDSRRATAEVAVAEAAAVALPQSQQQCAAPASPTAEVPVAESPGVDKSQFDGHPSTALGSFRNVDELIQALSRATGSSIRTTRESATSDKLTAESQPTAAVPTAADGADTSYGGQGLYGSIANVDELILALRRATGSRRSTAESAVDPTGLLQQEQQEQEVGDTGFDSMESLDDLLKAISSATSNSSRRGTSDVIAGDQQNDAQQAQQQKQLVDVDRPRIGEMSTDPADQGLMGSFSDVDALLQALRRATGSRRGTAEVLADADGQQKQQGAVSGSSSSLEELLGALSRPTADSRRSTADTVEATTGPAPVMPSAAVATAAAGVQQTPRSDVVDHLIESLRRQSGSRTPAGGVNVSHSASDSSHTPLPAAGAAAAAAGQQQQWTPRDVGKPHGSSTGAAEAAAAAVDVGCTNVARDAVLQQEQHHPNSPRNLHELVGALRRVTDNGGAGVTETAGSTSRSTAVKAAVQQEQTTPSSPRNLHELVGALRKVAGGNSKGPAEAAAATPLANSTTSLDAPSLQQQQQHTPSSPRTGQELVGALRRVTGTSNRATAQLAASAGAVKAGAVSPQQQQASGSASNLRDIVGTLRVVTANLGDALSAAQSVKSSTTAANAALQQQHSSCSPGNKNETADTLHQLTRAPSRGVMLAASASTTAAAEAALQQQQHTPKSPMSVHELVGALRRVTGAHSRQPSEAVTTPLAAGQQQQRLSVKPNTVDGKLVDLDMASGTSSYTQHKKPRARTPARQLSVAQPATPTVGDQCAGQISTESGASVHQLVQALSRKTGGSRKATADLQTRGTAAAAVVASPVKEPPSCAAASDQQQQTDSPAEIGQLLSALRRVTGDKEHAAGVVFTAEEAGIPALSAREIHGVQDDDSCATSSTGAAYKFPTSTQEGKAPAVELAMHDGAQHLGSNQQGFWALITAVIDPAIPANMQHQLQQVLAGAGATVVPGHPHLGCGANTVVTEPDRAGLWLPLLMDLVSPGWVFKACQQQKVQQLVRLTPDIARTVGVRLQQHAGMRPARDNAASSFAAKQHSNSHGASIHDNALVARDGRGELLMLPEIGGGRTAERHLMPRQLLVDLTWSIDQDPRSVEDGEAAAVLFQCGPSTISLLLHQDNGGLLGYATTKCTASEASQGITCGDVLSAVYSFYQQEVLLQEDRPAGDSSYAHTQGASQQQYKGRVVRRVVLMGSRLMFEGLARATQDPHSTLYEVCVA